MCRSWDCKMQVPWPLESSHKPTTSRSGRRSELGKSSVCADQQRQRESSRCENTLTPVMELAAMVRSLSRRSISTTTEIRCGRRKPGRRHASDILAAIENTFLTANPGGVYTKATGNGPFRLAAADLNGDGAQDVVVANVFDQRISVFFGQTSGGVPRTFAKRASSLKLAAIGFVTIGGSQRRRLAGLGGQHAQRARFHHAVESWRWTIPGTDCSGSRIARTEFGSDDPGQ